MEVTVSYQSKKILSPSFLVANLVPIAAILPQMTNIFFQEGKRIARKIISDKIGISESRFDKN